MKKNTDDFVVKQVDDEVKKIRENKAWRRDYMTLLMRDREKFEEGLKQGIEQGIEQGLEQGLEQGKLEIVTQLIHDGVFSVKEGAERLHMTETELEKHL